MPTLSDLIAGRDRRRGMGNFEQIMRLINPGYGLYKDLVPEETQGQIKDFLIGPIEPLVRRAREFSDELTEPRANPEADRILGGAMERALFAQHPVVEALGYGPKAPDISDNERQQLGAGLKGAVGGAVEGAAEIPSPVDAVTLPLSLAAKGLTLGGRGALRGAKTVSRLADITGAAADAGTMGAGAIGTVEAIDKGDWVDALGSGALTAMGGLGLAAGRMGRVDPVRPEIDPKTAQLSDRVMMGFDQPLTPFERQAFDKMQPALDDFGRVVDEIYQAAILPAASKLPNDALSQSVGDIATLKTPKTLTTPDEIEIQPAIDYRGNAAERAANVELGLTNEKSVFGYSLPSLNKKTPSELRVAANTLMTNIADDIGKYPHFAEMMNDPVKVGQELLRRVHRNMVHEVVHVVDMGSTHPLNYEFNASGQYVDPVTKRPSSDYDSGQKRFESLERMVKHFLKSTEIDEVTAKYAERALPFIRESQRLKLSRAVLPGDVGGVGGPTGVAGKPGAGGGAVPGRPPSAGPATRVVDRIAGDAARRGFSHPLAVDAFRTLIVDKGVGPNEAERLIKASIKIFGDNEKGYGAVLRSIMARPNKPGMPPSGGAKTPAPTPPGPATPPAGPAPTPPTPPAGATPPVPPEPPANKGKGKSRPKVKRPDHGWEDMVNQRRSAPIKGQLKQREFSDLDNLGLNGIIEFNKDPLANPRFKDLKKFFDDWLPRIRATGADVREKFAYLPQLWEDPPEKVIAALKGASRRLGIKPSFTMPSVFNNYEEGIKAGLTPKYKTLSELAGWYEERASKLVADRLYFNRLRNRGVAKAGRTPKDWQEYSPRYFPKARIVRPGAGGRKTVEFTTYKGPKDEVERMRQYFEPRSPVHQFLRDRWTDVKNLMLSSGVPLTGFNAYGYKILKRIGDVNPSFVGGKVAKVKALRLFADRKFAKRQLVKVLEDPDVIAGMDKGLMMGVEDHPFTFDQDSVKDKLKEAFSHFKGASLARKPLASLHSLREFHKVLFEDDLFGRIIPVAKATVFKSNLDQLTKAGIPREEALRTAAINANNVMTGINTDEMIGKPIKSTGGLLKRGRDFQDVLNFMLIAPSLLESNIKTGAGVARSLMNPKDPKGRIYRNVMKNVTLTYLMWNALYLITTRKSLLENPEGRKLGAPVGETVEGRERYLRTNLQEHDWFRLPLEVAERLAENDIGGVARVVGNRVHPMVTALGELFVSRRDYTGKPLYGAGQSIPQQLGNVGKVLASTTAPSYVQAAVEAVQSEKKGFEEGTAKALELPLMYSPKDVDRVSPGGTGTSRRSSRRRPRHEGRSRRSR